MYYLNTKDIQAIGNNWKENIDLIRQATRSLYAQDFNQPIKPYLLFQHDPAARIIAMPAFVGGDISMAGIKWIASFPKNINDSIQRAHSVTILNDPHNGKPVATLNTAEVSSIRTASVTGLMIEEFDKVRPLKDVTVGIIGFGPIGRMHLNMVADVLGDRIKTVRIYDLGGVKTEFIPASVQDKVEIVNSWEEAYLEADVFITCTVSSKGYINKKPKAGALLLNVSLRDFTTDILDHTSAIIVDDWDEVCRANTDIEWMNKERGLRKSGTRSIGEVVCADALKAFPADEPIHFNPMGMAIFDIAIGTHYYRQARAKGIGLELED